MAGYTRQSTFTEGDIVDDSELNNEFNALETAFGNTTGHAHDGSANSGPVIGLIGDAGETSPNNKVVVDTANNRISFFIEDTASPVEQLRLEDGVLAPVTDSDVALGTTSLRFSGGFVDTWTSGTLVLTGGSITDTSGTISFGDENLSTTGTLASGDLTVSSDIVIASGSITSVSGDIDFGNETLQTTGAITFSGGGSLTGTWSDLGTVTTVDINGGTIDGTVIGATTPAAASVTTLDASGKVTLTVSGSDGFMVTSDTGQSIAGANASGFFFGSGLVTGDTRPVNIGQQGHTSVINLNALVALDNGSGRLYFENSSQNKIMSQTTGGGAWEAIGIQADHFDYINSAGLAKFSVNNNGVTTVYEDLIIDDGISRLTINGTSGANRIYSTTTNFGSYEDLQIRSTAVAFINSAGSNIAVIGVGGGNTTEFYSDVTVNGELTFTDRLLNVTYSDSGINQVDLRNTHASGYGAYIAGGNSSNYALRLGDYANTTLFEINSATATFSTDVTVSDHNLFADIWTHSGTSSIYGRNQHASFSGTLYRGDVSRSASSAFSYFRAYSNSVTDTEFHLRGDGNAFADGSWSGGGADYAIMSEWEDGNPDNEDRVGCSVVLVPESSKPGRPAMRLAQEGEIPDGVISKNAAFVENADIGRWKGKYLKDDFGRHTFEPYEVIEWTETIPAETKEVQREIEVDDTHEVPVPAVKGYQFNMIDFKTDWVEVEQDDPEAEPLYKPQQKQTTRQVQLSDEQIAAQEIKVPEGAERITLVEETTREEVKLELQTVQVEESIDPKTGVVTPAYEDERPVALKKKIKLFNPDGTPVMEIITLKEAEEVKHSYEADKVPEGIEVPEDAVTISTEDDGKTPLLRRVLNPDYDETQEYTPRGDRKEWDERATHGLARIRKGQPTNPEWKYLSDVSEDVEEWELP